MVVVCSADLRAVVVMFVEKIINDSRYIRNIRHSGIKVSTKDMRIFFEKTTGCQWNPSIETRFLYVFHDEMTRRGYKLLVRRRQNKKTVYMYEKL